MNTVFSPAGPVLPDRCPPAVWRAAPATGVCSVCMFSLHASDFNKAFVTVCAAGPPSVCVSRRPPVLPVLLPDQQTGSQVE